MERMGGLGLFSQEQLRVDMLEVWKIIRGINGGDSQCLAHCRDF